MGNFVSGTGSLQRSTGIDNVVVCPVLSKNYWQITRREFLLFNQRWPKLEIWPSALLRNVQNIRVCMREKAIVFSLIQILIFWTLRNSTDGHISSLVRGPCVRKLLTGLIMYIYPLKIKNIVLYCIVLYWWFNQTASKWQSYFWNFFRILLFVLSFIRRYYFWPSDSYKFILSPTRRRFVDFLWWSQKY